MINDSSDDALQPRATEAGYAESPSNERFMEYARIGGVFISSRQRTPSAALVFALLSRQAVGPGRRRQAIERWRKWWMKRGVSGLRSRSTDEMRNEWTPPVNGT